MKLTDIEILENFITDGLAKYSITENWQMGVLLEFGKYYHKQVKNNDSLDNVSDCAFLVKFDGIGTITVIAKDKEEVKTKLKKEGFTKDFEILTAMSFVS